MTPLLIIPWQNDFIASLGDWLTGQDDFSAHTIIFPHNRPRRYLKKYLKSADNLPRPSFMPRMTSIADFMCDMRTRLDGEPRKSAQRLDQAEILYTIVRDLRRTSRGLLAHLPELDREAFLPWGMQLASLMEELLRHDMDPGDLAYMEGEVADYAAALLEQLRSIFTSYVATIEQNNLTTPGIDCRFTTAHAEDIAKLHEGTPLIAAGFYALSGAEDRLFRTLWQNNTLQIILHSDQALTNRDRHHWAVAEHATWLKNWACGAELLGPAAKKNTAPTIRFCEGFDRHSQLAALREELDSPKMHPDTAIVLPDTGALLPVLHHMPDEEINISMGYPLERTSLARLLESILNLQANRADDGRYYWKDIINLIRHPYVKMLGEDSRKLRRVLQLWEAHIRGQGTHADLHEWMPPYGVAPLEGVNKPDCEPLRQAILETCVSAFESLENLSELGDALEKLADMLHTHGSAIWHNFLLDAECLFRLTSSVVPNLKSSLTSTEPFSQNILFSILRDMLRQERVSFEPDPITGLQILGVLETRLLHFKKIYLLDAVEDKLPGTSPFDPLLPDPLRSMLSLPDSRERDNVAAYNFYRLIMGAEQAVIMYQSGIQPGVLDDKSVRSRFVEQLLWEMEKQKGALIKTGDKEIRSISFQAGPLPFGAPAIPCTDNIRSTLLKKLTDKGLTPSRLDTYLNCPKRFFFEYLTPLRPIDEVQEDGDRSEFGSLLHDVLQEFFTPHVGESIIPSNMDPTILRELYRQRLQESPIYTQQPHDGQKVLLETGMHRLELFLKSNEMPTVILGLEDEFSASVCVNSMSIPLHGRLDRVDRRDSGIHILDYKTGSLHKPGPKVWEDTQLFKRMNRYEGPESDDPLNDLAKSFKSIQLPAYLHLYDQGAMKGQVVNAALVELAASGKEQYLFPEKWTFQEVREIIESGVVDTINFLVRHIVTAPQFQACPGRHCQWCDFKNACGC